MNESRITGMGKVLSGKSGIAMVFFMGFILSVAMGAFESIEAAPGDQMIHNSLNTTLTTTRWQSQGGWGVQGGKYGEFTCETCHVKNATNIKRIRSTITTPDPSKGRFPGDGRPINFNRVQGNPGDPGTLGDDSNTPRTSSDKICEICHTYDAARVNGVNVHTYSTPTGVGLGNHKNANATDCVICHKHNQAFKPLDCNACHGNPPTLNTAGGPDGLAAWEGKTTGSTAAGKHATHATTLGYSCDACHNNSIMPQVSTVKPGFLDISIGFSAFGITTGSYSGQAGLSYNQTLGTGGLTCSTVYCHGSTLDGANKTPVWTGTVACGDCHRATAANPPGLGSHARHAGSGAGQLNLACSDCHGASGGAGHVTGQIEWSLNVGNARFGSGAKYNAAASGAINNTAPSASYQSCSTVYCHSNVQGTNGSGAPTVYASPQWGNNILNCGSCHKDMAADATAPGSHKKHAQDNGYACDLCHTGSGTNTIKHADTRIDVAFGSLNPTAAYSQTTNTPGNGYGTCSTTYCHGSGVTPAWGAAGSTTCASCHGASNNGDLSVSATAGHAIHYNTATPPASMGQADDFTNGYGYACSNCHPTNQHATGPASANSAANMGGAKLTAGQYTAGGSSSTDAKGFRYTAGTCSTNVCHTDGRGGAPKVVVTWNSAKTANNCGVCHNKAGDAAPTWSAAHTKHVNSYSANTNLTCSACHSSTASDNSTINGAAGRTQHANSVLNIDLGVFSGGSYTAGTGCSATYCHSQGTSFTGPYTQLTTSQAWSGTTACASCHTGGTVSGPSYTNGSPRANSHNKHVVGQGQACVTCHAATVNVSNAIIDTSKHVNKAYDILGSSVTITYTYAANGGTCATACHYTSTPKWGAASTGCNFCHAALPTSGAHAVHVATAAASYGSTAVGNTQAAYDYGCANCHPANNPNHGNGTVVVSLLPSDGGALKSKNSATASYNPATKTCTGVYCHSNGTAASIATSTTPSWGQTFAALGGDPCAKCHANSPTGTPAHAAHAVGIHYDTVYTGTTGLATAGTGSANAHGNVGTSTTISCNICHYNTVQKARNKNNAVCAACHNGDAASTALTRIDLDKRHHVVSGTTEVSFSASTFLSKAQVRDNITTVAELNNSWTRTNGYKTAASTDASKRTPTYNAGTCSTVDCHNGNSVSWTATNISCKSCHTGLPQ